MEISTSGNATFSATSSALTVIARDNLFVDAGQLYIGADNGSTDNTFRQVVNTSAGSFALQKRISGTFTDVLSFNNSNNATFAGYIETTKVRSDIMNNKADTANIIYRSGTDTIIGNNANALVVEDGGNVGIGTTSPARKLDVAGDLGIASSVNALRIGGNGVLGVLSGLTRLSGTGGASGGIMFTPNNDNTEKMRITSAGNVGIGTTAPTAKLQVQGASFFTSDIFTLQNKGIFFNGVSDFSSGIAGINSGTEVRIFAGGSERVRVDDSGNVGIGTGVPNVLGFLETGLNIAAGSSSSTTLQQAGLVVSGSSDANDADDFGYLSFTNYQSTLSADRVAEIRINKAGSNVNTGKFHFYTANGTALNESMVLGETGLLRLNQYGAGTLVTDANGNITVSSGGGAGGPFLPLTAGSTKPLSGILYAGQGVKFTGGTIATATTVLHTNNVIYSRGGSGGMFLQNSDGSDGIFIANDHVRFDTGGTERMRITTGGNVGIGVTAPVTKLNVAGNIAVTATKAYRMYNAANNGWGEMSFIEADNRIQFNRGIQNSGVDWRLSEDSASSYVCALQGNFGIGTTSPDHKLRVNGDARIGNLHIKTADFGSGGTGKTIYADGAGSGVLGFTSTTAFDFSNGTTSRIRVDSAGNVGIGTTSPDKLLEVAKEATSGIATIGVKGGTSGAGVVQISGNGNAYDIDSFDLIQNSAGAFVYNRHNSPMAFATSNIERMRITAGGNVGIGTTTPRSKLQVGASATGGTGFSVPTAALFAGDSNVAHAQVGVFDNDTFGIDKGGSIDLGGLVGGTGSSPYAFARISGLKENSTSGNYAGYFEISTTPTGSLTDTPRLQINSTGSLKLHNYDGTNKTGTPTYILGTDASGNVVKVLGGDIPGAPGGSGTVNTIPLWTPDGNTLGNSIITQPTSTEIRVSGTLKVNSTVSGYSSTKIQTGGFGDSQSGINILNSTTGYGYILFGDGSGADLYRGQIAYKHGDDFMAFNTAGSQRMTINSSGNVGIGVTNPSYKIEVNNTLNENIAKFYRTNSATAISHLVSTGRPQIRYTYDGQQAWYVGNNVGTFGIGKGYLASTTPVLNITSTERVGIGTASPFAKLHVKDGNTLSSALTNTSALIEGFSQSILQIASHSSGFSQIAFGDQDDGFDGGFIYSNASRYLSIETANAERIRIDSSGNVGIGTTSPLAKLQVGLSTSNSGSTLAMFGAANNGILSALSLVNTTGNDAIGYGTALDFHVASTYSPTGRIATIAENTSVQAGLGFFTYKTALTEKMRITNAGNVGIGTSLPVDRLTIYDADNNVGAYFQTATSGTTSGDGFRVGLNNSHAFLWNYENTPISFGTNGSQKATILANGNVGINTTNPVYKLDVNGGVQAGGKVTYTKSAGSLNTTGYAVAGITALPSGNGFSCGFTFTCFGGVGKYQRLVYGCYNSGGTWNTKKVIDEGTNDLDVVASANGSTITFTFKARSSTQSFTPRVTVEAVGTSINSTYA